jgi:hypothetical protein
MVLTEKGAVVGQRRECSWQLESLFGSDFVIEVMCEGMVWVVEVGVEVSPLIEESWLSGRTGKWDASRRCRILREMTC